MMLTLTKTTKMLFAADPFNVDEKGLPITSQDIAVAEFKFEDVEGAFDFAAHLFGEESARTMMYRRSEVVLPSNVANVVHSLLPFRHGGARLRNTRGVVAADERSRPPLPISRETRS